MRLAAPVLLLSLIISTSPAVAQDRAADEKAIRAAIAALDARMPGGYPTMVTDGVSWGGAYKLPRFGTNDKAVEIDHPTVKDTVRDANGRILAKTKTTVRKLEVAQAGDMAYDVSDIEWTMQRKTPTGTKNEAGRFTTSRLMVWKKVDGVWRPAASFDFPHDGSYPNPAGPRAR